LLLWAAGYWQLRYILFVFDMNMKSIMKIFILFVFLNAQYFSQVSWNLDYDSANFAFLKVDYNTYEFEGGYFTKFPYQEGYDRQYIPFNIIYNSPIDYGNIAFLYAASSDTIFAADIWWQVLDKLRTLIQLRMHPDLVLTRQMLPFLSAFPI
jgi:hypothetical protein